MGIILSNIVAIYRKELQSYFASPLAYTVAGVFWLLAGLMFVVILQSAITAAAEFDLRGQPLDVASAVLQDFLGVLGLFSLFILPILSMGLYAEERRRGTLELLATSPVTNWAVAVGKLLGVVTFFVGMVLPLLVYEAIAFSAANPPFQFWMVLLGHGALIVLGASVLSLGMFISSLTDSTILAAIFTFVLAFVLWIVDAISRTLGGPVGAVLSHLSLLKHYTNLVQGIVDISSVILLISYIVLGIFLTAQSIEALRFQRS